ncbi:hypothetical protein MTR_3g065630 [Medicago truncatula]|uniref:Uncharacterized protein n=1 Tax=Medicago truncatula TaxID=3880 RepID=G7J9E9_MEDTR|nr:hypothetical protein MTR_3g065630 [Medicago truncatula]
MANSSEAEQLLLFLVLDFLSKRLGDPKVLARSCPLLKSLKLSVADPVYRLSHFYMKDYDRSEVGWLAILDRCPLLESLDITGGNVYLSENLRERCREQIKILHLPVWAHIEEHYYDDGVYLEMFLNNEI